jgi:predicted RNA-binding Zn-ribbon protein involved in translation (DUF1610 family)
MTDQDECASCGAMLPADVVYDPAAAHTPCPNCGSTARKIFLRSIYDTAGATDSIAAAKHDSVRSGIDVRDPTPVGTRVGEYHLTVLAEPSEYGGIVVRLVDERTPDEIAAVHVGDQDDVIVELAIDVSRIIGG